MMRINQKYQTGTKKGTINQCNICLKLFKHSASLKQHTIIHTSKRPFQCEVCKKSFNRASTLKSHRSTHEGKTFNCDICSKGFYQKGNLKHHLFTHRNARPYKCTFCGKGFNQPSNLMCHVKKVHSSQTKIVKKIQPNNIVIKQNEKIKESIEIDSINTPEMTKALERKQLIFALLQINDDPPAVVRVINAENNKQNLVPINETDLIREGKLIVGDMNPETWDNLIEHDYLELSLRLPVVAIIKPRVDDNGIMKFHVESPGNQLYKIEENQKPINLHMKSNKKDPFLSDAVDCEGPTYF